MDIDQVIIDMKTSILVPLLAPYQPNVPPTYPNSAPTAGTIDATIVASGHPIQLYMLERIENKGCGVFCYADKTETYEKLTPFIDQTIPMNIPTLTGAPPSGIIYHAVGRSVRKIIIEVWAHSKPSRQAIMQIIRPGLTDVFRTHHSDGTVTLWTFDDAIEWDSQEIDSIYICRYKYFADFVQTIPIDVTKVLEAQAAFQANGQAVIDATATIQPASASGVPLIWDVGDIHP